MDRKICTGHIQKLYLACLTENLLLEIKYIGLFSGTIDTKDFFTLKLSNNKFNFQFKVFSELCLMGDGEGREVGRDGENLRIWLSLKKVFNLILSAVNCAG